METLSPLALFEQWIADLHDFALTYLCDRGVADGLAARVAHELTKELRAMPSWHSSAVGRQVMVVALYRTLVDAGHTSNSGVQLTGGLLRELSERQTNQRPARFAS